MSTATLSLQGADPLRPQPPGGMGQGALLALGVHALLVVALAVAVNWRSQTPQTFSAELWSATPQVAAPRAVESTPAAPPPPPPPPPAPVPTPRVAVPAPLPTVDPQIAIDKARQEKEKAEREKAEREKQAKAEKEKAERDKTERERLVAAKAKAEAQAKREQQEQRDKQAETQAEKQAEAQRLAKQREDNLKRMLGQAGATGAPGATGTALKDAAPSASYAGKLIAAIKPKILFTESVSGIAAADVEVRASPTGSVLSRRLVKSSGNKDWDDAVLRAIDRTGELPRDTDGRVPPVLVISFTP